MTGGPRDLHLLPHSFPTRRSSDRSWRQACRRSCTSCMKAWKCTRRLRAIGAVAKKRSISIDLPVPTLPEGEEHYRARIDHRTRDLITNAWSSALWGSGRSEEHTSELQSLMRLSYAVFCLKK